MLPEFERNANGYVLIGPVVRYYREQMTYTDARGKAKRWTQEDLAKRLGITRLAVQNMETKNTGLDSVERRRTLATLLNIPLALLGLTSLEEQNKLLNDSSNPTAISNNKVTDEKIQLYGDTDTLELVKAKHDKGSLTPKHIETIIHHIQSLDHSIVDQRIVAQYHVIAAHAYMKDLRDWANAQRHLDMVSAISSENRYDDISAIRLRVLGEMHDMQGDNVLGLAEVKAALELADKSKSKQLKVHILSFAGLIQAITALDQKDAFYALKLVDTTEKYVDETNDYPCLAPFTLIDYLENKADTLITLKKYSDALNCLAETKYCNITKMRNKEYIRILQAECYIKQKRPEYEEALGILSQIVEDNSHIAYYMNYAAKLHKIIAASSYGNAPDVVDLGIKLRNLRK